MQLQGIRELVNLLERARLGTPDLSYTITSARSLSHVVMIEQRT